MTMQEAYKSMEQGNKVFHYYFDKEEYIYMNERGEMYSEDGYRFEDGWQDRSFLKTYESGWSIWEEEIIKPSEIM